MAFQIDIGTDLFGSKFNTSLSFPSRPTVAELTAAAESYFDTKSRSSRPAGYPDMPYKIETFQLFDDKLLRWVDLYNEEQLKHGVQIWCFQPESIWHSDAQGVIPQAEKPTVTWTTPLGSPRRARIAADAGVPPTLSEKLRSVFFQIDGQNKGYLLYQDLEAAFRRCDMEFNNSSAGELFTLADANSSRHITYDEWVNFAVRCPSVVDALFFRMRDMVGNAPNSPPGYDDQMARQNELRKFYNDSWIPGDGREKQEKDYLHARSQEASRRKDDATRAAMDHQTAAEQAANIAQQHAQQHAAARQQASDQAAAIDAAQAAITSAEQQKRQAELALQQAKQSQQAAQQQADSEAAAQYAAEQHAAQQQVAIRQAQEVAQAAEAELRQARAAEQAALQAQQAAAAAANAQREAAEQERAQREAAERVAAAQAAQQAAQQQAAREAAERAQREAAERAQREAAERAAAERAAAMMSYSPPPPQQQMYTQPPSPAGDQARRDYESARRRAEELRRQKEDAEAAEREAWNKLYYSPGSPHYMK
eukprot:TRINITY_DN677_c0_g1_i1.p1 TRINITY_DN677_c0_g1~~TRINITY_DN677_c0_g1_i1.p1  ORF type:complete len:560 (+),score=184.93 TRINITY_DN677_c0_g1_i1:72-1682(+)